MTKMADYNGIRAHNLLVCKQIQSDDSLKTRIWWHEKTHHQ